MTVLELSVWTREASNSRDLPAYPSLVLGLQACPLYLAFFFFLKLRSVGALASVLAGRETNLSLARLTQAGSNFGNLVPGDLLPAYLNTVQYGEKFSGVVQSLVYKEI